MTVHLCAVQSTADHDSPMGCASIDNTVTAAKREMRRCATRSGIGEDIAAEADRRRLHHGF